MRRGESPVAADSNKVPSMIKSRISGYTGKVLAGAADACVMHSSDDLRADFGDLQRIIGKTSLADSGLVLWIGKIQDRGPVKV